MKARLSRELSLPKARFSSEQHTRPVVTMPPLMTDSLFGYMNVFLAVYAAGEEESAEADRRDQENDRQNKIKYVRTPIPEIQVETHYRQDQGHETEQAVQHINHLRSSKKWSIRSPTD
jgi:hypothetical protein